MGRWAMIQKKTERAEFCGCLGMIETTRTLGHGPCTLFWGVLGRPCLGFLYYLA